VRSTFQILPALTNLGYSVRVTFRPTYTYGPRVVDLLEISRRRRNYLDQKDKRGSTFFVTATINVWINGRTLPAR
jgi:hypothetical protein